MLRYALHDKKTIEIFKIPDDSKKKQFFIELSNSNASFIYIDLRLIALNLCSIEKGKEISFFKDLFVALNNNKNINKFYYNGSSSEILFETLAEGIGRSLYLQDVQLYCHLYSINLAKAMAQTYSIKKLKISLCAIGDQGVKNLADGISKNTSLTELDLTNTGIESDGSVAILHAVTQQNIIHTLSLRSNKMSNENLQKMVAILADNKSLKHLDLSYIEINDEGADHIAELILRNQSLMKIELHACRMSFKGTSVVQEALKKSPCARWIDLSWNGDMARTGMQFYDVEKSQKNEISPHVSLSLLAEKPDSLKQEQSATRKINRKNSCCIS